jgi:plasmid stabilization system protein ParE
MEAIYEFIEADSSESAAAWFNKRSQAVYSLEQYPNRGTVIPENEKLRQLLFGGKPNIYRIIYAVNKRNAAVNILHIRHGVRTPLATK